MTNISIDELGEWMSKHILLTFDEFTKVRSAGDIEMEKWCRGRIDGFLQILGVIDKDREAMVRADWVRVVTGEGFASNETDD